MSGDLTSTVQSMRITCPPGWTDASMLIVTAGTPGASGVTPTLVVSKEAMPDDLPEERVERLTQFVDRQIEKMRASLDRFTPVSRRDATRERMTAELRIRWASSGIPVTQSILFAFADDNTVITSTATAGDADFAALEPTFRTMLQSFRNG